MKISEDKSITHKTNYHHGDLRQSLLDATRFMIREGGVETVSLRKLADRVGVSRTAAYHYFKDKNVLLCTLAEEGFHLWQNKIENISLGDDYKNLPPAARYRAFIYWYLTYAMENSEYYDLMFGRAIWKQKNATDSLKKIAYEVFQKHVEMTKICQQDGILPIAEDSLRLAQVSWGTLHGLARLLIDGIYTEGNHLDDMCDCAANILMQNGKIK